MDPLGTHEGPAAYVRRTGLGVDRAWKFWNEWRMRMGKPGISRSQFRFEASQQK